jgi:uncharacterized membrane protein
MGDMWIVHKHYQHGNTIDKYWIFHDEKKANNFFKDQVEELIYALTNQEINDQISQFEEELEEDFELYHEKNSAELKRIFLVDQYTFQEMYSDCRNTIILAKFHNGVAINH